MPDEPLSHGEHHPRFRQVPFQLALTGRHSRGRRLTLDHDRRSRSMAVSFPRQPLPAVVNPRAPDSAVSLCRAALAEDGGAG